MSIGKNFLYNSSYQVLNIILPIITTPYISRVLGAEGVGENSYALSVAAYFGLLIMLGLNNYGNREIARVCTDKKLLKEKFWSIYTMQLMVGMMILLIYITCYYTVFKTPLMLVYTMYVASFVIDINWLFFGLEEFRISTIRSVVVKVLSTIAIFTLVKEAGDTHIYGMIISLSMLVSQLVLWPFVVKKIGFTRPSIKSILSHIRPNLLLFVPVVSVSVYKILSKIILGVLATSEELGYYDSVDKIITIPIALVTSLGIVMLPRMSKIVADKQEDKMKEYINKSLMLSVIITVPICLGLASVADKFVPVFYGGNYDACILLMRLMLPSCIFVAIANVIRTQYLIPAKRDGVYIVSVIGGAVVNIAVNLLLIPSSGAVGAAIGLLVAECFVCVYQMVKVRKELPVAQYIKSMIPYVLVGVLMYLVLSNIIVGIENDYLNILIKVLIGGVIYITLGTIVYIRQGKLLQ